MLFLNEIKRSEFFNTLAKNTVRKKEHKHYLDVLNSLRELSNKDINEISSKQEDKLFKFLRYAFENSKYFRGYSVPEKIDDFKAIPFMDKKIISKNEKDILIMGSSSIVKRNTGGSTGEPFSFYSDLSSGYADLAHHAYLYELMGYSEGDVIIGCGGIYLEEKVRKNGEFWVRNNRTSLWGQYVFSTLYLNKSTIETYLKKILSIKPKIMRGYPSFYYELARYIIDNKIVIDFEIKGLNLTSEKCSAEQKYIIEKAFHSKIYFEYGHTEISVFAYTTPESDNYKSSSIYGYVEVLDESGNDTKIGEVGELVVTGFLNIAMPFIRYRTGDLVRLSSRNGGIVTFSEIFGRSQDYVLDKYGSKQYLTGLIFGQHFKAFSVINKWQIIQEKTGEIKFVIDRGTNYSKEDEKEILDKITRIADINIEFDYINEVIKTKAGKQPFLIKRS
ncbi:phenylacetate--CoA ligase family protein [Vibrio parahaemolyticus]|uniref:hypothetical protein n=1 Tax=Vibrio parahaemolyticus TaxID=670 RepID=UPI00389251CF|nr:phenylacetate--CoA ligase family protein [Vibrio parahaemolyticus]